MSVRRACATLRIDRSLYVYKSKRGDQAHLKHRIRDIRQTRIRYGYRRVHVLLQRDGWAVNVKRIYRLYRELGLQLRNKNAETPCEGQAARGPNRGTPDQRNLGHGFRSRSTRHRPEDSCSDDRRYLLAVLAGGRSAVLLQGRGCRTDLEHVCKSVGYPKSIRVDQGSEFVSRDLDIWAYQKGVILDFSRPGKPTDNSFIESFNGKLRSECLNAHWFMNLDDAKRKMEDWRRDYNEVRPHSAIGNIPPIALINSSPATLPP